MRIDIDETSDIAYYVKSIDALNETILALRRANPPQEERLHAALYRRTAEYELLGIQFYTAYQKAQRADTDTLAEPRS